ncbi:hypothetical protein BGW38_000232, partial [Lunasporangiospora selenospora]
MNPQPSTKATRVVRHGSGRGQVSESKSLGVGFRTRGGKRGGAESGSQSHASASVMDSVPIQTVPLAQGQSETILHESQPFCGSDRGQASEYSQLAPGAQEGNSEHESSSTDQKIHPEPPLKQERQTVDDGESLQGGSPTKNDLATDPLMAVLLRRERALRKRLASTRIEATEALLEVDPQAKATMDQDRFQALEHKSEVLVCLGEFDELLGRMSAVALEENEKKASIQKNLQLERQQEYERIADEHRHLSVQSFIHLIRLFYALNQLESVCNQLTPDPLDSLRVLREFCGLLYVAAESAETSEGVEAQDYLYSLVKQLTGNASGIIAEDSATRFCDVNREVEDIIFPSPVDDGRVEGLTVKDPGTEEGVEPSDRQSVLEGSAEIDSKDTEQDKRKDESNNITVATPETHLENAISQEHQDEQLGLIEGLQVEDGYLVVDPGHWNGPSPYSGIQEYPQVNIVDMGPSLHHGDQEEYSRTDDNSETVGSTGQQPAHHYNHRRGHIPRRRAHRQASTKRPDSMSSRAPSNTRSNVAPGEEDTTTPLLDSPIVPPASQEASSDPVDLGMEERVSEAKLLTQYSVETNLGHDQIKLDDGQSPQDAQNADEPNSRPEPPPQDRLVRGSTSENGDTQSASAPVRHAKQRRSGRRHAGARGGHANNGHFGRPTPNQLMEHHHHHLVPGIIPGPQLQHPLQPPFYFHGHQQPLQHPQPHPLHPHPYHFHMIRPGVPGQEEHRISGPE